LEASVHLGQYKKITFDKIIKSVSPEAYDLLEKLFEIDY
jgi:hypothetical protein